MTIEDIKKTIIGKWQFQDGRILNFLTGEDFILLDKNNQILSDQNKLFVSKNKYGQVQFMIPSLFIAIGIIKEISNHQIVFDDYDIDGKTTEFVLKRVRD